MDIPSIAPSGLMGTDSRFEDWAALGRSGKAVQAWFRPRYETRRKEAPQLPSPWLTGFHLSGLIWGLVALLIWPVWLLVSLVRQHFWQKPLRLNSNSVKWALSSGCVVALFVIIQASFVIVFWSAEMRFTLMMMPLLAVLGCLACQAVLEGVGLLVRRVVPTVWRRGIRASPLSP